METTQVKQVAKFIKGSKPADGSLPNLGFEKVMHNVAVACLLQFIKWLNFDVQSGEILRMERS